MGMGILGFAIGILVVMILIVVPVLILGAI